MSIMRFKNSPLLVVALGFMISGCATNTGISKQEANRVEDAHPYRDIYRVTAFSYIGERAPSRLRDALSFTFDLVGAVASTAIQFQHGAGELGFGTALARDVNVHLAHGTAMGVSAMLSDKKGTYVISYTSAGGLGHNYKNLVERRLMHAGFIVSDSEPVQVLEVGDYIVIQRLPKEKRRYKAEYSYVRLDMAKLIDGDIPSREIEIFIARQHDINLARQRAASIP